MKLSEAMRLGSMMRPQAYRTLFDPISGGSCAMGAALEAVGLLDLTQYNMFIAGAQPPQCWTKWSRAVEPICPACGDRSLSAEYVIFHLNNDHVWTRERIADWVESIERAHEQQPVEPQPVSVEA